MKKIIFFSIISLIAFKSFSQKCLQLNITPLMGSLQLPGDAASSFSKCITKKNDHGQIQIINYGSDLQQLDTMLAQKSREFTNASVAGLGNISSQMPSQQNIDNAKQLAEQLRNMTPEQQKAWAMQQAQQQMANPPKALQEDGTTAKLVMETNDIAVNQLYTLTNELAAKLRTVMAESEKEKSAIKSPDISTCPPTKPIGQPTCGCANGLEGQYWKEIIAIRNKYNDQRVALLQSYIPRIKALTSKVDDNIAKLQYGDAVKTTQFKKMLQSAQSSAFGNSFAITVAAIEDIRKEGSDAYAHKTDADNLIEYLDCQK